MTMNATEQFYDSDVFVGEVDFTLLPAQDGVPPLQEGQVEILPGWLNVASVAFAAVLTIASSTWAPSMISSPFDPADAAASPGDRANMTAHLQKAERAKRLFAPVALNEVEQLPDPDYGL